MFIHFCSQNVVNEQYENNIIMLHFCLENNAAQIQAILTERCDGNRNILHACISMSSPTSNKENDQGIAFIYLPYLISNMP